MQSLYFQIFRDGNLSHGFKYIGAYIRRTHRSVRYSLCCYIKDNFSFFLKFAEVYLRDTGRSPEEYLDALKSPLKKCDDLCLTLLACMYQIHIAEVCSGGRVAFSTHGIDLKSCDIILGQVGLYSYMYYYKEGNLHPHAFEIHSESDVFLHSDDLKFAGNEATDFHSQSGDSDTPMEMSQHDQQHE